MSAAVEGVLPGLPAEREARMKGVEVRVRCLVRRREVLPVPPVRRMVIFARVGGELVERVQLGMRGVVVGKG
jgi:hypothetical protein